MLLLPTHHHHLLLLLVHHHICIWIIHLGSETHVGHLIVHIIDSLRQLLLHHLLLARWDAHHALTIVHELLLLHLVGLIRINVRHSLVWVETTLHLHAAHALHHHLLLLHVSRLLLRVTLPVSWQ